MSPRDPNRILARRAKRIVVKVGSSTLTDAGQVRPRVFAQLSRQIARLCADGREIVVVSSGAIAIGSRVLGWTHPGRSMPEKQAAAAVGQIGLVELWQRRFRRHGREIAQILVTRTELENRERFLNARRTLLQLLALGVVPIVNENDTVATEEIRFGDNDNLSATILNLVEGDLLVLLTDVDGLFRRAPVPGEPLPELIDVVERVTPEITRAASGSASAFGRGGMTTKLEAARSAARSGATTIICHSGLRDGLLRVAAGERVGTIFLPGDRLASRKHWLAFTTRPRGTLTLDEGAVRAVRDGGRSLLAAGIVEVRGSFGIGDTVSCVDPSGNEIARGLTSYASDDIARLRGRSAKEIRAVLGYSHGDAVVHRDDLVVVS